jgi:acetoin utilization protein AcuC
VQSNECSVVTGSLTLVWDERLTGYDFGPGHPLAPVRVELTIALARELGVLGRAAVTMVTPAAAQMTELELVHDADYIDAVRQAGLDGRSNGRYGLGTPDNPVFSGMHEASALVAGATLAAARAVWRGEAGHAVNIAGGLHHAMRRSASGFCVYNDPAIAIRWMLAQGAERIAYVDLDVHHGDGVQAAFYDDPRVLTISLHEHPATRAGCGRSTRWFRRCCERSRPRCWSASMAATATGSTRWPTSSSASTRSGAPS